MSTVLGAAGTGTPAKPASAMATGTTMLALDGPVRRAVADRVDHDAQARRRERLERNGDGLGSAFLGDVVDRGNRQRARGAAVALERERGGNGMTPVGDDGEIERAAPSSARAGSPR